MGLKEKGLFMNGYNHAFGVIDDSLRPWLTNATNAFYLSLLTSFYKAIYIHIDILLQFKLVKLYLCVFGV